MPQRISIRRQRLSRLAALLLPIVLSACATTGKNADTRFYLLSSLPASSKPLPAVVRQPPLAVVLAPVHLPQYLERPQLVSRITQNRLQVNEFDNWGGNLAKNMNRVLAANLSLLLATADIQISNTRRLSGRQVRVEIQVQRFEPGPDGRAELKVQWRLFEPGRKRPATLTRLEQFVSAPIPAGAPGAQDDRQADVAAMSTLLGKLSQAIAAAILRAGGS